MGDLAKVIEMFNVYIILINSIIFLIFLSNVQLKVLHSGYRTDVAKVMDIEEEEAEIWLTGQMVG